MTTEEIFNCKDIAVLDARAAELRKQIDAEVRARLKLIPTDFAAETWDDSEYEDFGYEADDIEQSTHPYGDYPAS